MVLSSPLASDWQQISAIHMVYGVSFRFITSIIPTYLLINNVITCMKGTIPYYYLTPSFTHASSLTQVDTYFTITTIMARVVDSLQWMKSSKP